MMRVLFVSVVANIALATNAQNQELLTSHDGFNVLPKNITANGTSILYTIEHDTESQTFNIFDENFLPTKTFRFIANNFPRNLLKMKALAPISKKTLKSVEYDYDSFGKDTMTIQSMDEFVEKINELFHVKITIDNCFYDYEGNFAYHENNRWAPWQTVRKTEIDGETSVIITEIYYYYNKVDKNIHKRMVHYSVECDLSALKWEIIDNTIDHTNHERIVDFEYNDFDNSLCHDGLRGKISQTLFNNDDKYEYVVESFREIPEPSDLNTSFDNGLDLESLMEDGKLVVTKSGYDHYYKSCFYVVDEDGNKLYDLPESDKSYIKLYKLNGKMLIETETYGNDFSYGLYLLNPATAGISEIIRTQSVPSNVFYNVGGVRVSKNAKGLVIQEAGKKFINR